MCVWLCSLMLALFVCSLPEDPGHSIGTWIWEVDYFYPLCSPERPELLRRCSNTSNFLLCTLLYLSTSFYLSYLAFQHSGTMQSVGGILCFLPCWPKNFFIFVFLCSSSDRRNLALWRCTYRTVILYIFLTLLWFLMPNYRIPLSYCIASFDVVNIYVSLSIGVIPQKHIVILTCHNSSSLEWHAFTHIILRGAIIFAFYLLAVVSISFSKLLFHVCPGGGQTTWSFFFSKIA